MTDPTRAPVHAPAGLGGALWLFGLPLMALGSWAAAMAPALWYESFPGGLPAAYAGGMAACPSSGRCLSIVVELAKAGLLFGAIVVAEAFFRRSPRFRAIASLWLSVACVLRWSTSDAWPLRFDDPHASTALAVDAASGLALCGALLYLWRSRRVRNTFHGTPGPLQGHGPWTAILDGPRDWGGGVWCLAGMLALLVGSHAAGLLEYGALLPRAMETGHVPPTPIARALDLVVERYTHEQVLFVRTVFVLHLAGSALALWSLRLFAQRAAALRWTLPACAVLGVAVEAAGRALGDARLLGCAVCHDGALPGDALQERIAWLVTISLLLLLPASRRAFAGDARPASAM